MKLFKITLGLFRLIQIMLIHIIIKVLVSIGKEIMIKLFNVLHKPLISKVIKQISIIIEDLLIGKKKSLIKLLEITPRRLRLIQNILKHFIIERFVGINWVNLKIVKKIIYKQSNYSLKIYQHFIILEPLGKKLEVQDSNLQFKILIKRFNQILNMLLLIMDEVQYGIDLQDLKRQFQIFRKQSKLIQKILFIFIIEVAVIEIQEI